MGQPRQRRLSVLRRGLLDGLQRVECKDGLHGLPVRLEVGAVHRLQDPVGGRFSITLQRLADLGDHRRDVCGRIVESAAEEATADVEIRARHRGDVQFPCVLYDVDGPHGGHAYADLTTPPRTVHIR
ncbi:hypothetical protein [Streptomyces sp. NPDC003710]